MYRLVNGYEMSPCGFRAPHAGSSFIVMCSAQRRRAREVALEEHALAEVHIVEMTSTDAGCEQPLTAHFKWFVSSSLQERFCRVDSQASRL